MLGNDIIDLNLTQRESNWKRKNYLSKIFSSAEQALICEAHNPDLTVWLMWSMKEAVYKIVNRKTGLRFYNPQAFCCSVGLNDLQAEGQVCYNGTHFLTHTEITKNFLHTIGVEQKSLFNELNVFYRANQPDYQITFNNLNKGIHLKKNNEMLPVMHNLKTQTEHIASVSHHGDYLSIVYLNN